MGGTADSNRRILARAPPHTPTPAPSQLHISAPTDTTCFSTARLGICFGVSALVYPSHWMHTYPNQTRIHKYPSHYRHLSAGRWAIGSSQQRVAYPSHPRTMYPTHPGTMYPSHYRPLNRRPRRLAWNPASCGRSGLVTRILPGRAGGIRRDTAEGADWGAGRIAAVSAEPVGPLGRGLSESQLQLRLMG